jgi:hypothetical protein
MVSVESEENVRSGKREKGEVRRRTLESRHLAVHVRIDRLAEAAGERRSQNTILRRGKRRKARKEGREREGAWNVLSTSDGRRNDSDGAVHDECEWDGKKSQSQLLNEEEKDCAAHRTSLSWLN